MSTEINQFPVAPANQQPSSGHGSYRTPIIVGSLGAAFVLSLPAIAMKTDFLPDTLMPAPYTAFESGSDLIANAVPLMAEQILGSPNYDMGYSNQYAAGGSMSTECGPTMEQGERYFEYDSTDGSTIANRIDITEDCQRADKSRKFYHLILEQTGNQWSAVVTYDNLDTKWVYGPEIADKFKNSEGVKPQNSVELDKTQLRHVLKQAFAEVLHPDTSKPVAEPLFG